MVSFYLSFKSRLIEEIVEDEGAIWTDERISWISINRGYNITIRYRSWMVPFVLVLVSCWGRCIVGRVLGAS